MAKQSKDFSQEFGLVKAKGNNPVSADLYGGANSPVIAAGSKVRWEEMELTETPEKYKDVGSTGNQFTKNDTVSAVPVSFSGKTDVFLDHTLTEIGCSFGFEELAGPVGFGAGLHSHLISLDPQGKDQRLYTAAEAVDAAANTSFSPAYNALDQRNVFLRLFDSLGPVDESAENCSIASFKLSCESKNPLKLEISGSAERIIRDEAKSQSPNMTDRIDCEEGRLFMRHCSAFVGVVGQAAEQMSIMSFEVGCEMGQAEDLFVSGTSNGGLSRGEPVSTGEQIISGSVVVNKHDTIKWHEFAENDTKLFMKFDFSIGLKRFILCLPLINIKEAPYELGDGSKINISFEAHIPCDADPFTTERSISGSEQELTYPETPFYLVWSNENENNVLWQED